VSIPPKLTHLLGLAFLTDRLTFQLPIHFFAPSMRLPFQGLRYFSLKFRFDTSRYHRFHRCLQFPDQFLQVFFPFLPFHLLQNQLPDWYNGHACSPVSLWSGNLDSTEDQAFFLLYFMIERYTTLPTSFDNVLKYNRY